MDRIAHFLDKGVVDAIITHGAGKPTYGSSNSHTSKRDKEQHADEHAPEGPAQRSSARQIGCLLHLDFAILLAHNDAGIINLDELSLLQVNELIAYLFRTVLVIKGHDDEITHVFAPFLKSLLHLASISSIVSR